MMMNRLRERERRTRERIRGSGERKIMNNEKSEGVEYLYAHESHVRHPTALPCTSAFPTFDHDPTSRI
jgi:hypothetical protein